MNKINFLLFAGLFFVVLSCKKKEKEIVEESPPPPTVQPEPLLDTIKPLSYFPVYPGSNWKYSDGSICTTSSTYKRDTYSYGCYMAAAGGVTCQTRSAYVPFYNNEPMWGYQAHRESQFQVTPAPDPLIWIISETKDSWSISGQSKHPHWAKVIARDTTIVISGVSYYPTVAVLYLHQYIETSSSSPVYTEARRYFTKGIGLVKTEILDNTGVVSEVHLVSYFINK